MTMALVAKSVMPMLLVVSPREHQVFGQTVLGLRPRVVILYFLITKPLGWFPILLGQVHGGLGELSLWSTCTGV
jgi:hypothetical protein